MLLMTVFGAAALFLASLGVYGLMAYSVRQRTQEIGIRMALGAGSGHVLKMVVGQGMCLALVGVVIGIVSALGLSRLLATFLFGVKPRDLAVFIAVPLTLTLVSLIAVWLPARRAAHVDPSTALRTE
jgi:ABC-type antimicrobial peptide transport system permease subunit